ncbi:MAG TPA: hypothetical protein VH477_13315 [Bryobacteraceae bacterium]
MLADHCMSDAAAPRLRKLIREQMKDFVADRVVEDFAPAETRKSDQSIELGSVAFRGNSQSQKLEHAPLRRSYGSRGRG